MSKIFGMSNIFNPVNFKLFRKSIDFINDDDLDFNYYFDSNISLASKLQNEEDLYLYDDMVIILNGELYNKKELIELLSTKGYEFETKSDSEIILKGFKEYKEKILDYLNGIYSLIIYYDSKIFIARDRLGIKPMYYSIYQNDIIFSTKIRPIIEYTDNRKITLNGLKELLGMIPQNSIGKTVYDNIYELPSGNYLIFDNKINIHEYWNLLPYKLDVTFDEAKKMVKDVLDDSIKRCLDGKIGVMLSGGLDSSIITAICSLNKDIKTYSIDFELNNEEYKIDKFNTSKDNDYIKYMLEKYNLENELITISINDLFDNLKEVVKLRDYPAMADIDSSFYTFTNKINDKINILTGECSDEVFGGYRWYYTDSLMTFPWIRNTDIKYNLINDELIDKLDLNNYVDLEYKKAINNVKLLDTDSDSMKKKRTMMYLNINYFMQNLLHRADMLANGLNLRVPFADYRVVELIYNIDWEYMYYNNKEKGLLREIYKDILPDEIYNRKKSPFPKIHTKKYKEKVKKELLNVLNGDTILTKIFKKEEIIKLMDNDFDIPWFGQLMTIPQILAFMYQIDYWFKEYKLVLDV